MRWLFRRWRRLVHLSPLLLLLVDSSLPLPQNIFLLLLLHLLHLLLLHLLLLLPFLLMELLLLRLNVRGGHRRRHRAQLVHSRVRKRNANRWRVHSGAGRRRRWLADHSGSLPRACTTQQHTKKREKKRSS
jgi:hypothetical protein